MPVTNDTITRQELDFLMNAVVSEKIMEQGKVTQLDDFEYPTLNRLEANQKNEHSVKGAYRWEVKGRRNQRIEYWDGLQKLRHQHHITPFTVRFPIAKGHFGDVLPMEFLERQGIDIDYGSFTPDTKGGSRRAGEVVVNYLRENYDDVMAAIRHDKAIRIWSANALDPKCFTGIDGLLSATSATAGENGGVPKTHPLMAHNLMTNITVDNLAIATSQFQRALMDGRAGAGKPNWNACGDNYWDMLHDYFEGGWDQAKGAFRPGKWSMQLGQEQAQKMGTKFGIGMPMESFCDPYGTIYTREQIFKELDRMESPSVPWADRCYTLNFSHLMWIVERPDTVVNHGMPRDQVVAHSSHFMAHTMALRAPLSCGVMVKKAA